MFLLLSCFFCLCSGYSQSITFSKNVFREGEEVRVTVIGGLQGIENGIRNRTDPATDGVASLGIPPKAGFYRVDFKFAGNVTKSYLIGIIKPGEADAEDYNIPLEEGAIPSISSTLAEKMMTYFKKETNTATLLAVSKAGIVKFGKDNAVSLVLNVSFCMTVVSGVPVVTVICKNMSVSNLKKLGLEILKSFLLDMRNKNYLTTAEYNAISGLLTFSQIGAVLKNNCSLVFKSLTALSTDPNLKLAMGYLEQQCKATVLIIEKVKIIP